MSSYGYMHKGYSSTQNGVGSYADDWNKSIHTSSSDHSFRPVLVDAEGRKMPIIFYNIPNDNGEYYVSNTETIVHGTVNSPLVPDNKQSLPTRFELVRTYGSIADELAWRRSSSLVQRPVEEKWNTDTEPVNGFSKKVNELTNKVLQTEAVLSPCHLSPLVSDKRNSPITKVEPLGTSNGTNEKNFGRPSSTVEKNWGRPSSTAEKSTVEKNLGRPSSTVEKGTIDEKNLGRPSSTVEKNLGAVDGFSQKFDDYIKRVRANYTNNSTEEVEPPKTNGGVTEKKGHSPKSPVRHSEPVNGVPKKVDDFINKPQSVQSVTSPLVSDYKQSPPTKVEPIATNGSVTTPADDPKSNEVFNKVQNEASRPRLGPLDATYWRQTAQAPVYGYDGDLANKVGQPRIEPVMISTGGWSRPRSHVTWASPLEGSSTNPTNGINTAIGYPMEIEKPSPMINIPPGSQVPLPVSTGRRRYTATIDSEEAARKYGGTTV